MGGETDDEQASDDDDDDDGLFGEDDERVLPVPAHTSMEALRLKRKCESQVKAERRRPAILSKKAERRKAQIRRESFEPVQLVENFVQIDDEFASRIY
jgi:hypothetical protein